MTYGDLKIGMKVCIHCGANEFISTITAFDTCRKSFRVADPPLWLYVEHINVEKTEELNKTTGESDAIKPNHYKLQIKNNECEVRDVMQAVMTEEEYDGFLYGNILKYILRAKRKNGIEDLKKAKQYLEWLVAEEEDKNNG